MVCCGNPDAKFWWVGRVSPWLAPSSSFWPLTPTGNSAVFIPRLMCDWNANSGHPSGFVIWVPLVTAVAAWVLGLFSTWGCQLANLPDGVAFSGIVVGNVTSSTSTTQVNYKTDEFKATEFGFFWFLDGNTNNCVSYTDWIEKDAFWKSAAAFSLLRGLFGLIVVLWLFLCTCCPVQPVHKNSLFILSGLAFICSAFSFLFYGNDICKEYGCELSTDAWYQLSGAILNFLTTLFILGIPAQKPSWVLQQREEHPYQEEKVEAGIVNASSEPPVPVHVTGVVVGSP